MKSFKLRPIPADFVDRFPDGDFTIGRGADPRGFNDRADATSADVVRVKKAKKSKPRKRVVRTAAE